MRVHLPHSNYPNTPTISCSPSYIFVQFVIQCACISLTQTIQIRQQFLALLLIFLFNLSSNARASPSLKLSKYANNFLLSFLYFCSICHPMRVHLPHSNYPNTPTISCSPSYI